MVDERKKRLEKQYLMSVKLLDCCDGETGGERRRKKKKVFSRREGGFYMTGCRIEETLSQTSISEWSNLLFVDSIMISSHED